MALIDNGCMKESLSRTAIIDDLEEDIFILFFEFGYQKKYTTPCRKDNDCEEILSADGEH